MRCLTSAALAAGLLTVATPAWAQTAAPLLPAAPGPIPRAVVDLRASMAMLGQDAVTATGLGLTAGQLGSRGFGGTAGVHVYPLRTGGFALGLGGDALIALSQSQPLDSDKKASGSPIRRRLSSAAFQVSGNFGHRHGWSYLTVGMGPTAFETYRSTDLRDGLAPATLNYGGGARWFRWGHAAFTADIRFYATKPAPATAHTAGRARQKVVVLSAGVSFR
jgi:hypothetical protein